VGHDDCPSSVSEYEYGSSSDGSRNKNKQQEKQQQQQQQQQSPRLQARELQSTFNMQRTHPAPNSGKKSIGLAHKQ